LHLPHTSPSYANIQGKAALIAKFKHSGVMKEVRSLARPACAADDESAQRPEYRPVVFHSSGPRVGMPAEFPVADDNVELPSSSFVKLPGSRFVGPSPSMLMR
jgi:hypothetical protein